MTIRARMYMLNGNMKDLNSYTRYEKTRIIAARALQIAQGSPILIETPKDVISPVDIAILEFQAGAIPIDIKHGSLVLLKKEVV